MSQTAIDSQANWVSIDDRLPELNQPLRGEPELSNMESLLVEIDCDLGIIFGRLVYSEPASVWADSNYEEIGLWNVRKWREITN